MSGAIPPSDDESVDVVTENRSDENTSAPENPERERAAPTQTTAVDGDETETTLNSGSTSIPVEKESNQFNTSEKQYIYIGSTFNNTNFDGDGGTAKYDATWETELKEVDRRKLIASGDEPDTVFDAVCEAWSRFRIAVLRYHPGEQRRAEKLMQRIACWAGGSAPEPRLLTTGNDRMLPLRELALPNNWPQVRGQSLVYLARRTEPLTTRFFSVSNCVEVQDLEARLEAKGARLLVSLAAEWDAVEGADPFDNCVCAFELESIERTGSGVTELGDESSFDVIPRMVAGLFPGLPVREYLDVVDQFVPKLESQAHSRVQRESDKDVSTIAQAAPTRHQRWVSGDIDRVLAELEIRYDPPPRGVPLSSGEEYAPGYYLADDASPYADPGWIVSKYPALLASQMEWLLARYLGKNASERYQQGFLVCSARLDAAGVHRVNVEGLMQGWNMTLDAQGDIDRAAWNMCVLVAYVQAGRKESEARFASAVIDGFADTATELELEFQREVGVEPLQQAFASQEGGFLTEPDKVWGWLIGNSATSLATKSLVDRQAAAIWMMLSLARRWPTQVARATTRVLARVRSPETAWCIMGRALTPLNQVPRCAALNLEHVLSNLIDVRPDLWTSFAWGVADAYANSVQDAIAEQHASKRLSEDARQVAIDGQRLAYVCLYVLAPRIYASKDAKRQRLLEYLCPVDDTSGTYAPRLGRIIAMSYLKVSEEPMLGPLGEGAPTLADIVRFLRGVTVIMQSNEGLTSKQVSESLIGVLSGLRALFSTSDRRALVHQARDSLDSQFQLRDHFERVGNRAALVSMRKRIRATQAVLRGLRASK